MSAQASPDMANRVIVAAPKGQRTFAQGAAKKFEDMPKFEQVKGPGPKKLALPEAPKEVGERPHTTLPSALHLPPMLCHRPVCMPKPAVGCLALHAGCGAGCSRPPSQPSTSGGRCSLPHNQPSSSEARRTVMRQTPHTQSHAQTQLFCK